MSKLFDYEWQFLLQMVSRIYCSSSYENVCEITMRQLRTLIPFDKGVCFQAGRRKGEAVISNPIVLEGGTSITDYAFFMEGDYPRWSEFVMSATSIVFRQSDIIGIDKWESARVYREIWEPQNIYWRLLFSVVFQDNPLMLVGIYRERNKDDFSHKDIFILTMLKDVLERKVYNLLAMPSSKNADISIHKRAAKFSLTKRGMEIIGPVCNNMESSATYEKLYIGAATINKRFSNIYTKTKLKTEFSYIATLPNEHRQIYFGICFVVFLSTVLEVII